MEKIESDLRQIKKFVEQINNFRSTFIGFVRTSESFKDKKEWEGAVPIFLLKEILKLQLHTLGVPPLREAKKR